MIKQEESEMKMKLDEWKQTLPEKKQDVTADESMFGVGSLNYFPLWLTKKQEDNIQRAKEKGRHKFGTKGRFVLWKDYVVWNYKGIMEMK